MANVYNAVHHDDDSTTRKIYVPPSRFPVERQEVSVYTATQHEARSARSSDRGLCFVSLRTGAA